ncbi:cell surface protein [Acidovorax sp.]|uniref:cell surface protein n=1 Tax=Acidovorax sp. TaxID=1872122 RepID=UPI0025BA1483|nr:cell surface protein [Acidovorax sp.]
MKKNVMALSIAAMIGGLGFAGAASAAVIGGTAGATGTAANIQAGAMAQRTATALSVAEGGVGHALVVPYYNAQNGNMTVLHVTNTDQDNGKLVKVRFRSASNSDDVLDFQVFMSPGDVWTAAVMAGADGVANIVTADNTCTVPALTKNVAQPFVQTRLPAYATADAKANMTREGYVEIFNMADVTNVATWDAAGAATATGTLRSPLFTATKHVGGVAPCSVAGSAARTLVDTVATTTLTEGAAVARGLQTPTSGLMGDWYIINVPQTTTFSGAATAIRATVGAGGANGRGNFVHFPQLDSAAAGVANELTADPLFRTANVFTNANAAPATSPALALLNFDLPDMSTPYVAAVSATAPLTQAQALATALRVTSITNQYANDASISAKTDWVFSMPTRRYNVAANYAAGATQALATAAANYRLFSDFGAVGHADDMFYPAQALAPITTGNTSVDANGNICVIADSQRFFDREETTGGTVPVFSPGTAANVQFCGEVSVLAFRDTGTSVLGASVARRTVTTGSYENGWAILGTDNGTKGLPILGASFIKLENPSASAGKSGTYGITWPHRFTR